jgi:rhodanese-related sulfurtransferase
MTDTPTLRRGKNFAELVAEAKAGIQEINAETLRQWQAEGRSIVVLDVRESDEFHRGALPQAINVPRGLLELSIADNVPNQETTIVAYCGGGSRSALAAQTLKTMGYDNVVSLAGGYRGWIQ